MKTEGVLHSLATHLSRPVPAIKDILKQFKLDQRETNKIHVEIIARVQEKAVLCLHLNETTLEKAAKSNFDLFLCIYAINNYFIAERE